MIPDLSTIEAYRRDDATQTGKWRQTLEGLPLRTWTTAPVPRAAGVDELMLYRPAGVTAPAVFVNLHGGGFVLGGWEADDRYCRLLASESGCAVVNVDYVLAPEHPFPAATEQVYRIVAWLAANGSDVGLDGTRIAVGGHSAGGNLAAAVTLLARDRAEVAIRAQILDYAPLDLATDPADKPDPNPDQDPAWREFGVRVARRYADWYLPDRALARDPLVSPLLAGNLAGLPAALVITAELDTLAAEGAAYARRLAAAGVAVDHISYAGAGHGFTHFGEDGPALDAWRRMAAFLRRVLAAKATGASKP